MTSPIELGRRIRETRLKQGLTLKALDARAGLSATHLSEIERGRTSPTVGALLRIARALGHEPAYFLEPEVLPDTAHSRGGSVEPTWLGAAQLEPLSPGITGGRLRGARLSLPAGGEALSLDPAEGGEAVYIVSGEAELAVDGRVWTLTPGDAAYYPSELPRRLRALGGSGAEVIVFTTAGWPTAKGP
jgi:transcriptional regulator with XRE-family HTH domain